MEKDFLKTNHYRILIIVLGSFIFMPFLGRAPLFDWDEINFAESAREMIVTGNYARVQINFQPFWEKPPLFFWLQVLSMKVFGINEYAARFPNALFGVISLLTLFEIGRTLKSIRFGLIWCFCLLISFLPHVYFKSGVIDPVFNYFIFTSIFFLTRAQAAFEKFSILKNSFFAGILTGLAILTKGPVGLLMPILVIMILMLLNRFRLPIRLNGLIIWIGSALLIASIWFLPETIQHGSWFIKEFIDYQIRLFSTPDAGHAQPVYYHFLVVLTGCFPMSIFALPVLFNRSQMQNGTNDFGLWMKILFWTVLILFSLVTTKIIHYSSLTYLPLSYLAAVATENLITEKKQWSLVVKILYWLVGIMIGSAMLIVPIVGMFPEFIVPYIKDPFAVANLNAKVHWTFLDFLPGIIWFIAIFLGYSFWVRRKQISGFAILGLGLLLSTTFFLFLFPKKIAGYTQQSPTSFYSGLKGKNVYLETLGFKSYAQYFYFQKPGLSLQEQKNCLDEKGNYSIDHLRSWYLNGEIDKPVFFVVKSQKAPDYLSNPEIKIIEEKNGFSFLKRQPR